MLHAKFQDHRTSGSGEEDFLRFLPYWHGGHLGHVTWIIYTNFCSPFPRRLHIKFGFDLSSGFRGEYVKNCGRTTDGRRTDAGACAISSPCEPEGSGELKSNIFYQLTKLKGNNSKKR